MSHRNAHHRGPSALPSERIALPLPLEESESAPFNSVVLPHFRAATVRERCARNREHRSLTVAALKESSDSRSWGEGIQRHRRARLTLQRAFTLVELMISIALALILIVGINKVFQISSMTVGAGQALSTISRDDRTAHTTMYADLRNAVTSSPKSSYAQSPAFFIASSNIYAFRNSSDQQSDNDGNAGTSNATGNPAIDAIVGTSDRVHRTDVVGFLASGDLYPRQTANDGQYVSSTTSSEAYIWYGHMAIPNNAFLKNSGAAGAANFGPGVPSGGGQNNDNNLLASDWILGRVAMLLTPAPPAADVYIAAGSRANPLAFDAAASAGVWKMFQCRYDIAKTSISQFLTLEQADPKPVVFRDQMIWVAPMDPLGASQTVFRFSANPFPSKPLTSATMAQTTPIFLKSCGQFIVEFAGDYVTQDTNPQSPNYGLPVPGVAGQTGDKQIDFAVDKSADPSGTNPTLWVQKVRWYGFPRDINGDGHVDINDVVPLRDLKVAVVGGTAASFERVLPAGTAPADYAGQFGLYEKHQYVCSWGPDTTEPLPKMIRITFCLDDPNGRLGATQFFEYVIDLTQ